MAKSYDVQDFLAKYQARPWRRWGVVQKIGEILGEWHMGTGEENNLNAFGSFGHPDFGQTHRFQ